MEAGGSKLEGKQASDGNQGGKGGEKGKKKEKKEKKEKEKKIERVAKGSDGGQESWVGLNPGEKAEETVTDPIPITIQNQVQPEASTSLNLTTTQVLPETPSPHPFNKSCNCCIWQMKDCTRRLKKGIPIGACLPCRQGKVAGNLSRPAKQPQEQLRAPVQAPEPPKAPSPGPSKGPTCPSARATSKPPVTPLKRAPSLGPGPSPSKKAKASVSRSRPKTPLVTQKAKFANDAGVTPSASIKVYHPLAGPPPHSIPQASALELIEMPVNALLDPRPRPSLDPTDQIIKGLKVRVTSLENQVERIPDLELQLSSMAWVLEALWEQVTPPACVGLSPDAETPVGNGQFPSEIRFPRIGGRGSALIPPLPSVGQHLCRWRQVGTIPPPSSHAPTASSGCGDGG
ncbi:hypothetical protein PAXRUDRAFT_21570 [Paxillus rubicundulus Ve08.2h10]|uniref:Uncharacterized protein n=1 Tax=Paxillus rubicundulus Ve08.2h10 TaxID=930991 RepID=A0A0D0CPQ7_9AGAM|nr:hypothetical protein PAXRUDRAFT_21570 [Paxillus rubicundulus Ve08.2h10]